MLGSPPHGIVILGLAFAGQACNGAATGSVAPDASPSQADALADAENDAATTLPQDASTTLPEDDAGVGSCTVPAAMPPVADAGACASHLLVAASPSTITTPDSDPANLALASSPTGDRFLAVWTDGGWTTNGVATMESVWAALVQPTPSGAQVSVPSQLTGDGSCPVAAWNGTGFSVAWADSAGLRLQGVDAQGAPVGSSAQVLAAPSTCPTSLVATGAGLAVAWYQTVATTSHGLQTLSENAAFIDTTGVVSGQVLLDQVGPGVAANVMLAELQGQTYAAYIDWPDSASQTAVAPIDSMHASAIPQSVVPGFLDSFLAAQGSLWVSTSGGNGTVLFQGAPGAALRSAAQGCSAFGTLAGDSCGRLVGLGIAENTPSGIAEGFFAQSLEGTSSPVALGAVSGSALACGGGTFGVLWYSRIGPGIPIGDAHPTGSLSFTTLSWQ